MKPQRMEMATLLPLPTDEQGRLLEHVTHLTPLEDLVLPAPPMTIPLEP